MLPRLYTVPSASVKMLPITSYGKCNSNSLEQERNYWPVWLTKSRFKLPIGLVLKDLIYFHMSVLLFLENYDCWLDSILLLRWLLVVSRAPSFLSQFPGSLLRAGVVVPVSLHWADVGLDRNERNCWIQQHRVRGLSQEAQCWEARLTSFSCWEKESHSFRNWLNNLQNTSFRVREQILSLLLIG